MGVDEEFRNIEDNLGNIVDLEYSTRHGRHYISGRLYAIEPYCSVSLISVGYIAVIPFVSMNSGINLITLSDGEILYENQGLSYPYDGRSKIKILQKHFDSLRKEKFGSCYEKNFAGQ